MMLRIRISVADPGCLSRILIFFYPFRIPDPGPGIKRAPDFKSNICHLTTNNVADQDQCSGYGMFIPDPDF